jgi:acetyl esterase/lipase
MQPAHATSAIADIGYELGPEVLAACRALLAPGIASGGAAGAITLDQPYGPDPRQMLDVYAPADAAGRPVLLWVHGGGFVRGDRRSDDHPFEAHIGHWAASHGFVGVVPSYRLAPDHRFPAGGEDVLGAFDWIRAHIADLGGDPDRVILAGCTS